jgi:UDP-N-acetylglucosamine acyltransferase
MANNATLAGHVHIGDWVIMAGFSGAHQFCRVGAHAFIGMYAGVNRDVPAYIMVSDTPGVPRGINAEGLKRRNFDAQQIRNIKNAYRVIYRGGLKLTEAIAELEQRVATQPELEILVESLRSSERGIIR